MRKQIEVEIIDTSVAPSRNRKSGHQSKTKTRHRFVPLSSLGLNYHLSDPTPQQSRGGYLREDELGSGKRIDFEREVKDLKLFQYIYQKIDGQLTYPSEFTERRMSGTVNAVIFFSSDGDLLENETQYDSNSGYFKVLVARALRRAFREPIPVDKLTIHSKFKVVCSFRFEITEHNDAMLAKSKTLVLENELQFYRHFQKSVLEWQVGPLSGLGPIPSMDVLWFPRKIGEIFTQKVKVDPLDKYRNDPAY